MPLIAMPIPDDLITYLESSGEKLFPKESLPTMRKDIGGISSSQALRNSHMVCS